MNAFRLHASTFFRSGRRLPTLLALFVSALAPSSPAWAEGGLKIGYVDVSRAASQSKSISQAIRTAETELKNKQEVIELMTRDFQAVRRELAAKASVMAPEKIETEEARLQGMRDEIDKVRLEIDQHLRRTETRIMGPAVDRILKSIREVAKEQGFDLVLREDVVLFAVQTLDITPLVVEALDSEAENQKSSLPDS